MKRILRIASMLAVVFACAPAARPALAAAPTLAPVLAATDWLNGRPPGVAVRGNVVLVDVFTVGCFNCKNVTPNLRKLASSRASRGLVVIGIHAPETPYERDRANVERELKRQGIVWPVAIDNDFAIWHAFGNEYWPTQYLFDRHGVLRRTIVGDSQDAIVDKEIDRLLAES